MWYFKSSQIKYVHFEISNYCNAACPECPREDPGEIDTNTGINRYNEWINTKLLNYEAIKNAFNKTHTPDLNFISFCGCFGDALTHPDLIKILNHFIDEFGNQVFISISTNGGLRTEAFWSKLANVLKNQRHEVIWGIDGLEDTNHLYRKNVFWHKLQKNWRAFNSSGGKSVWQFILFPHNFHQIKAAEEYAMSEGFVGFKTIKSMRNAEDKAKFMPDEFVHQKVFFSSSKTISIQASDTLEKIKKVSCESKQMNHVFVFSDGSLWPCSKLGAWKPIEGHCDTYDWEKQHQPRSYNIYKNTIEEIMNSPWWNNLLKSHVYGKFCRSCKEQCGQLSGKNKITLTQNQFHYKELGERGNNV